MINYYRILGVKDFASIEDVKIAYKKLSKKFHPDLNENDKFFEERFREIQEAYDILTDSVKKQKLDEYLKGADSASFYTSKIENEQIVKKVVETKSEHKSVNPTVFITILITLCVAFFAFKIYESKREESFSYLVDTVVMAPTPPVAEPVVDERQNIEDILKDIPEESNSQQLQDFYTIGSSKEEVLRIQGTPTRVRTIDYLSEETWHYDNSSVHFKHGKVREYDNFSGNLRIRL